MLNLPVLRGLDCRDAAVDGVSERDECPSAVAEADFEAVAQIAEDELVLRVELDVLPAVACVADHSLAFL